MNPTPPPRGLAQWVREHLAADPDREVPDDEVRTFEEVKRWFAETPEAPAMLRQITRTLPEEFYRRDLSAADLAGFLGTPEDEIINLAERGHLRGHRGQDGWTFSAADGWALLFPDEGDHA
jgi:hypothetical protein